jgi:hypothetical protein
MSKLIITDTIWATGERLAFPETFDVTDWGHATKTLAAELDRTASNAFKRRVMRLWVRSHGSAYLKNGKSVTGVWFHYMP